MTAVGGPLVVAACTEFTSLILLRFVEERQRGLEPKEAVDVAAARTGRAFIVSALTAIAGVAVIATSSLPLLRDFGIIVAMNVAVALLSALVVPAADAGVGRQAQLGVPRLGEARDACGRPMACPIPRTSPSSTDHEVPARWPRRRRTGSRSSTTPSGARTTRPCCWSWGSVPS